MKNQNNQINIFDIANYIIEKHKIPDLTNLKLQKLIFYIYSLYLVKTNGKERLFDSHIEAWPYGPVFPELYFELRNFKNGIVDKIQNVSKNKINGLKKQCVDYILQKYGDLKAWELAGQIHEEGPWLDAYQNNISFEENIIRDYSIFDYYQDKFDDFKI